MGAEKIGTTTLGSMGKYLRATLKPTTPTAAVDSVVTTLLTTLKDFRNRDLHHYRQGVRALDLPRLRDEIIPALNRYLALVQSVQ